ncbi:Tripeptidyl-peptidase sed1 [Microsporum canis]|uniref:Tripeptidyl-peptidase SED1 n=1 Tax=Arthroderma otae (strain ATCC MYA-4605 / CBS 113480) TaxID=554155 RepID=SED1_ARTOC|nr:aorsin [Microsporum canis CBS 113480]C5FHK0.1 RecName: Full=Tripeptidyl-peptidase SED1; AltName: Full=Sedolisin-A; Flags: Precursor [Microsporum canis CBS 113480]EEQ28740.1 aorsin [Microsporum canis CBS 113480]
MSTMIFMYFIYIVLYASGIAANLSYHVHEKRSIPVWWQRVSRIDPHAFLPLTIALAQQNLEHAEDYLLSVSDPSSPQYAQYWTAEAVAAKFAPSEPTARKVMSWLNQSGIAPAGVRRSKSGGELYMNITAQEAEKLLHTTFYIYKHQLTNKTLAICEKYSVATFVEKYVDFITTTEQFHHGLRRRSFQDPEPRMPSGKSPGHYVELADDSFPFPYLSFGSSVGLLKNKILSDSLPSNCDKLITPDCLRALYHIPVRNTSHPDNSLGIIEFTWVGYLESDLDKFFNIFQPSMVGNRPKFESIDGGFIQTLVPSFAFNGEADLDIEYAMALTHPLNITNYQVGDIWSLGNMNNFLASLDSTYCSAVDPVYDPIYPDPTPANPPLPSGYNSSDCGTHKPTKVISISYAYEEGEFSPAYERRQCLEYLKLGLQGVTVVFASGDHGTATRDGMCGNTVIDSNQISDHEPSYVPTFPSTCPYVTSVGGTQVPANGSVLDAEVAFDTIITSSDGNVSSRLTSAGGFSNVFAVPGYQATATRDYLQRLQNKYTLPVNLNVTGFGSGRGFPDVAANAAAYATAVNGKLVKVYGTSASAPVFASVIAWINDARLNMGKQPVGFVNPVLYANPQVLNDVAKGSNYDCANLPAYHASSGWDPVTGLGTPNFDRMLDLFLQLS